MKKMICLVGLLLSFQVLADGVTVHLFCQPKEGYELLPGVLVTTTHVEGQTFRGLLLLPAHVEPLPIMSEDKDFSVSKKSVVVKGEGPMNTHVRLRWNEKELHFSATSDDSNYITDGERTLEEYGCTTDYRFE